MKSSPPTEDGSEPRSRANGLVTCTILFSGVGRLDSVSSLLRSRTGTSNPNLQEDMGRTWVDMGGHGWTWEDIRGHGRT